MTREQYIQLKNSNQVGNIIYSTYVELCKKKEIQSYNSKIFFIAFSQWELAQYYVNEILQQLDLQFRVVKLIKDDKIIKLL